VLSILENLLPSLCGAGHCVDRHRANVCLLFGPGGLQDGRQRDAHAKRRVHVFVKIPLVEDRMIVRILLLACSLLLASELPAASQQPKDDPWNPQHIDALPPDIRHYIAAICKGPAKAQHDFATYSPTERRWRINLEYLGCDGLRDFRRGHQCLDVDFVQVGSRFRLASKQYRECGF
jgi:hypothetical protein